jgi:hypothetical protein
MQDERIAKIYNETKHQIASGLNIYDLIPIIYRLVKLEDYEGAEGVYKAVRELGIELEIPETDAQMERMYRKIEILKEIESRK